jgi:hypothetical protein
VARARSEKTGLSRLDDATQRAKINWSYAIANTTIRRWVDSQLTNRGVCRSDEVSPLCGYVSP